MGRESARRVSCELHAPARPLIHLKLDELIRSQRKARDTFADLEEATDEELSALEREFRRIRGRARAHRSGAEGSHHE